MRSLNLSIGNKIFLIIFVLLLILVPITIFVINSGTLQNLRSNADLSADAAALSKSLLSNQGNDSEQISVAVARKEKMKALAQEPENFLLNVIPEDVKTTLPLPAQDNIEKRVEIEGVLLEDVKEESSKTKPLNTAVLQILDNEGFVKDSYQVYLREDMPLEPLLGKVKVKGYVLDNILVPISVEKSPSVLGISTTGDLKIGVVMVNFKNDDSDIKDDFTREQLAKIYFTDPNSVTNYINKTSMGKINATGDINDVYGWIDLPGYTRKQVCDIYEKDPNNQGFIKAINQLAKQQATARGKTFGDYDIIGYVFPAIPTESENDLKTNCYWNAITKGIPGDPIVVPAHFLNGDYDGVNDVNHGDLDSASAIKFYSGILAHEVGHSLGLSHANAILCGNKQIASYANCSIYFYGDRFDLIGGAWDFHAHTSAKNKVLMGWIPDENQKTINADGTYTLYSASKNRPGQTQSFRIDRPVDGGDYFLEYRTPTNGDGGMPDSSYKGAFLRLSNVDLPTMANYFGGTVNEWRTKQSYLIDVDKTDTSGRSGLLNPTFKDGMTFTDLRNGINIKQISHDDDKVTLAINVGGVPCELGLPGISVVEPSLSGKALEKLQYQLTLINNNSESCKDATYNISISAPSGWTANVNKPTITLGSGEKVTFVANLTSPAGASVNDNPFSAIITAQNAAKADSNRTKEIRYNVEISEATVPTNTPSPTKQPTSTPSPTRLPSKTPTPSLTPGPTTPPATNTPPPPTGFTMVHFPSIKLHGIGTGGDNINSNASGNTDPKTKTRNLIAEIIDPSNNSVGKISGSIIYHPETGDFSGDIAIPDNIPENKYVVKVRSDKYITSQIPGILVLKKGTINSVLHVSLSVGDANLDDARNLLDFNAIIDCYSDFLPAKNCSDALKKLNADLNDDGKVNQADYNLFLRESSVQSGQ